MEQTTSINIRSHEHTFEYLLGVEPISSIYYNSKTFPLTMDIINNEVFLLGKNSNSKRFNNDWWPDNNSSPASAQYIPEIYNISKIKLYFPVFSVNTYDKSDYALDVYTFIRGTKIILGNYIISRMDLMACPMKKIGNQIYCEYIEFDILDPYYILYGDSWKNFRKNICGETETETLTNHTRYVVNNETSSLHFSLYPVRKSNNIYSTILGYVGGQNSMVICKTPRLSVNIKTDFDKNETVCIVGKLEYNSEFKNIFDYVLKTYNIDYESRIFGRIPDIICEPSITTDPKCTLEIPDITHDPIRIKDIIKNMITYELVICDKNNIYLKTPKYNMEIGKSYETIYFDKDDIFFENWEGYHKGMFIMCFLNIQNGYHEISIPSNKIPLTEELFKYFVGVNSLNSINKDIIDDMSYNINTVNKIVNNIIQVDNAKNSKSNIIQPVFFRSYGLNNLILHPDVTENICINLDIYKSKVDTFVIKIGNSIFVESGRTTAGIVFNIVGNKLDRTSGSTVFFILNEKGEVITSGKYMFEV